MSKKEKMTYESALENQKQLKASIKEKNNEITDYKKTNKISAKNEATGKVLKGLQSLEKSLASDKKSLTDMNDYLKANRPVAEKSTKYAYPAWCSTSEKKKKYRTLVRSGVEEKDVSEKMVDEGKRAVTPKKEKAEKKEKTPAPAKKGKGKSSKAEVEDEGEMKAPVKKGKKTKKKGKKAKKDSSDD